MIKFLKRIYNTIFDREADFDTRMYNLVMLSGALCALAGILICISAHVSSMGIFMNFLIFVGATGLLFIGNGFPKLMGLCRIILSIGISILIPLVWVYAGGMHSGVNLWLCYGLIFICLLTSGVQFLILTIIYCASVASVIAISLLRPEWIWVFHSERDIYVSTVGSILTVTLGLVITLLFYRRTYMKEQQISRAQAEALEAANEAQKSFFANISHEIRTPINTIIGLNEMNLRDNLSEDAQENCENIQSASRMLLSLINDVLDISKIQSGKMDIVPEKYEIASILSDIVNMIWVRAHDKGLEFHLDVADDIPTALYGDAVRIKQVLINLLTNAVKYTEKGSVTLSIKGEQLDHKHVRMYMAVSDTGIGIKKEDIQYLFDSFKRVDQQNTKNIEGTGLGLAISGQLVELMGGEIKVDSIYQQGSTFTIILEQEIIDLTPTGPVGENLKRRNKRKQEYMQSFEAPDAKILVVDDNRMNQLVATKLLSATKLQIDVASSGRECLEMTLQKRYDVILMDHVMPEMDGLETLNRLRNQTMGACKGVPVIALTANAGTGIEDYYKEQGFQGYIVKPVSGILLEEMLLKFLPKELVHLTTVMDRDELEEVDIDIERRYRKKIIVSADSVCDIPKKIMDERSIPCMPYFVESAEGRFREGKEIWPENLFDFMEKMNGQIKSNPPSVEEYETFFGQMLGEAEQLIHVCMTSKTSKGYENAAKAAESFDNVYVIDSAHLSTGMGLMVLEIADMIDKHYMLAEILAKITQLRYRIDTNFILANPKYLYQAGRIPYFVDRICKLFSIYPILSLKKGVMKPTALYGGRLENAYKRYIRAQFKKKDTICKDVCYITYSGCSLEQRKMFRKEIEEQMEFDEIIENSTSSAIASNCGPGTMGVFFLRRE